MVLAGVEHANVTRVLVGGDVELAVRAEHGSSEAYR
jgi:hypothetical protein